MSKAHLKYISFFLFFWIWAVPSFVLAQQGSSARHKIDSLQNVLKSQQDDSNKVKTLLGLSSKFLGTGNYDSALIYAKSAQKLAEKIDFKKGVVNSFMNACAVYYNQGNYSQALQSGLKALDLAQQTGEKKVVAGALGNIGNIYLAQGDYPKTLDYYLKALAVTQEMGDKHGAAIHMGNIGIVYYQQGNYPEALEYVLKASTLTQDIGDKDGEAFNFGYIAIIYNEEGNRPKALEYYSKSLSISQELGDKQSVATDLSNMGGLYNDEGNSSKALEYFFKSLSVTQEIGDKAITVANLDNIGKIYKEQGNSAQALDYFFRALTIAREMGEKTDVSDMYIGAGEVYIGEKNYKLSKIYLDSALTLSQNIGDKKEEKETYAAMSVLDSAQGNYKNSFEDYKKYVVFRDSIINKESVKKTTQLEVSYEFQKREDSIKVAQEKTDIVKRAESNRKTIITWSSVVILLLAIILGLLFVNRQQIKHRKDNIISEKEKNLLKLEKQRMEDELTNATALLDEYIKNVVQKNTLLEQFKAEIEELKKLKSKEIDENRIEHLEHLGKQTILTEDDWNKFKELFEQVHKGYFTRMREKLPDITQAEMRLVCLTKLKLGTKEMAGILGVSFDTIRKSRYRLRKKLNLPEEDTIDVIAESI